MDPADHHVRLRARPRPRSLSQQPGEDAVAGVPGGPGGLLSETLSAAVRLPPHPRAPTSRAQEQEGKGRNPH